MNIPFLDLKAQYYNLKEDIDKAIWSVIENTAFIGGEDVDRFREGFAKLYGVQHCVPCGNGTDALYIAMKMMGIGPGDQVITTASSWISTSETITQTGAQPVFIDIDEYYTIGANKIENKITGRTKAIIPVHLYGQVCNMPDIKRIAQSHNLKVIEDCAQSHLSSLGGKYAGLWGDIATFSFYPGKNLGAYGDAGCIITDNEELATACKRFANHGSLTKHNHEIEGINSRLDSIQAAVLNVKLPHLRKWTEERIRVANIYLELLKELPQVELPKIRKESVHSFHVFAIKVPNRNSLKRYLGEKGVATQVHYPRAMPFMKAYSSLGAGKGDYPNAYDLQERQLSLPIYPEMSDQQVAYVVDCIKSFYCG